MRLIKKTWPCAIMMMIALVSFIFAAPLRAQDEPAEAEEAVDAPPVAPSSESDDSPLSDADADNDDMDVSSPAVSDDDDPVLMLLNEVRRLSNELRRTQHELAQAQLEAAQAQRELAELRQFIADHEQLGQDFMQYTAIREIAEREARRRAVEEARQQQAIEQAEREQQRHIVMAQRQAERAERARQARYRRAGFSPLGLDVYASRMAYRYQSQTTTPSRIDYARGFGHYLRLYPPAFDFDYSSMTISGSVLNAADDIRNIGVAITFFDEYGNQVGHEIVRVNNARPNVPYPFTSVLDMALNRPFDSVSIYVLYADPVVYEEDIEPPPANTQTEGRPPDAAGDDADVAVDPLWDQIQMNNQSP